MNLTINYNPTDRWKRKSHVQTSEQMTKNKQSLNKDGIMEDKFISHYTTVKSCEGFKNIKSEEQARKIVANRLNVMKATLTDKGTGTVINLLN